MEVPASTFLITKDMSYYGIHETLSMELLKLQHSLPQDAETVNNKNRLKMDGGKGMDKDPTLLLNMMTLHVTSISGTSKPF